MTEGRSGRRTFFHQRGANSLLSSEHFDFSRTRAKILHLGYPLLLDKLDEFNQGRPRAFEVLARARSAGLQTSLDCVSVNSSGFRDVVVPLLPEVDYLFVNEFEAEKLTGIQLCALEDERARHVAMEASAKILMELGVRRHVFIHYPRAVYALSHDGQSHWQRSLNIPQELIKGAAGAGDAFAAGVLYGIHEGWPMSELLKLGVCTAASSLFVATCSDGVMPVQECLSLAEQYRPLE
jgi:sugar/nucleoside kinase (ribokinase family)